MQDSPNIILSVSPYTSIAIREGEVHMCSLLSPDGLAFSDARPLLVLGAFRTPRTQKDAAMELSESLDEAEVIEITDALLEAGILVHDSAGASVGSAPSWEPHDLAFHTASALDAPVKRSTGESPPAVRPAAKPLLPLEATPAPKMTLAESLALRTSRRSLGGRALESAELSALFAGCARNTPVPGEAYFRRPYPSGGGTYSLEIYPVVGAGAVKGVAPGLYRYDPDAHALEMLASGEESWEPWTRATANMIGAADVPVVLLVTSRFARVTTAYTSVAYRLALVEYGCFVQASYLMAEALGLGVCAVGCVSEPERLASMIGASSLQEPLIGQLALGTRD